MELCAVVTLDKENLNCAQMCKSLSFNNSCEPESYDECLSALGKAKEGRMAPLLSNQPWNQKGEKCPRACCQFDHYLRLCYFGPPQEATE